MVECPCCEGCGEIRHPNWGSYNCPEPSIPCPVCRGDGEVTDQVRLDYLSPVR